MKTFKMLKKYVGTRIQNKQLRLSVMTSLMMMLFCFPAFASDTGNTSISGLLANFTTIAAWMWTEVGLLLTFIMEQPILFLTLSLFFIGAVVSFFLRVYHSV